MTIQWNFWPTATFLFVVLSWCVYLALFLFRKKPPKPREAKRERFSKLGIALQGSSYGLVWAIWRPPFTPLVPMPKPAEILLALGTMALSAASVWTIIAAARALGKQGSYLARLVEGHKLIVSGPYRFVRHPIYAGMFGQVLASGLAMSHWAALVAAMLLLAIGTAIRANSEEKLLREVFGDDFEAYARCVPAIFPRLR